MLMVAILIVVLALFIIFMYNNWIKLKEAVVNNFKAIGVQLDARGKVIDSMISISKRYLEHEENIFVKLAELRAQSQSAQSPTEKQKVEDEIDTVLKSGGINVVMENYPELRSNEIFLRNQEAIQTEEQKLMYAKRAYNNSIEELKVSTEKFPNVVFVGMFGSKAVSTLKDYPYWDINEEKRNTEEEKRMTF
jgi:LemA protein